MCWGLFFNEVKNHLQRFLRKLLTAKSSEACNFIKIETVTQVFSREICETFKYTFFIEHLRWLLLPVSKITYLKFSKRQQN